MLSLLHIENIAIIEQADIVLQPGFTVLTGETGAGKSIIIDSIGAIMGQRTSRELIRNGAKKGFVSAVFEDIPPALQKQLEELGLDTEDDVQSAFSGSCLLKDAASAVSICGRFRLPCSKPSAPISSISTVSTTDRS